MPDFTDALNTLSAAMPNLMGAFVRGIQLALGGFLLLGIIYFLRRYL